MPAAAFTCGTTERSARYVLMESMSWPMNKRVLPGGGANFVPAHRGLIPDIRAINDSERIIFIFLSDVNFGAISLLDPVSARIGAAKVEILSRKFTVVPLADVTHVVAIGAEQAGVGFGPGGFEGCESGVAMAGHPLPGEERCATHTADCGGDASVGEAHPFLRKLVEMRCFDNRIPRAAQRIKPPVIGEEDDNVHRFVGGARGER